MNKRAGWNDFSGDSEYGEVKEQLIAEQLGMCCYCEVIISLKDCHVEHLKPKSIYPQNMFAYENLLASCNQKESCGHKKGKWYSSDMVSPLDQDCEKRFTYTLDGRIIPSGKEDTSASETIEQLGLNCPKLKNQRKNIILALDNGENGPEPNYLQTVAAGILKRERAWPFGFYTVLLFLAELYEIPIPQ
ncbi:MAG: TIGR02646 family protein [Candidatus Electrothrix sp. ATG2]|nr:TIGR02646 family protein [Candidatus Electrothrix sp. ATG2]